ncbi:MAG: UbiX family flavin prenyltransferase, partial [Alphaproteobacteria bacterium]
MDRARKQRLIIGLSGASGAQLAVDALEFLKTTDIETHLVSSKTGVQTLHYETDVSFSHLKSLADHYHHNEDFTAAIASGSFETMGMLLIPCSVKSMAEIASGVGASLLTRAADVVLKERRKLVLMVREAPLSLIHIRNMETITLMGGIIFPPLPIYYAKPQSIDQMNKQILGRA